MLQLSTGLRNQLLASNPLRTILNLGFINVYANSGVLPASADAALVGGTHTLICQISNNNTSTGLTLAVTASGGAITKNLAEVWSKACTLTSLAAFWRFVAPGDSGLLSLTDPRIQGLCGLAGSDINFATLSFVNGTVYSIDNWSIGIPTL